MHSSWVYSTTSISGYRVTSQKLIRDGKERETRNAHRIIRSGVLEWGELAFLRGLPLVIVLAAVALIIEKTQFLARADAKHPLLHQAQGDGEDLGRRAAVHPRA